MLYTPEFVASLPKPVPFVNPWVIALCNFDNGVKTRELIEKWYEELPDDIKPRFKAKLLSIDDEVFKPAFHELSIYRYCQEEGWDIEYEPELPNGLTPDLIVDTKKWGKLAIEVTTVFDANGIKLGEKRKQLLLQKISLIETDKVLELTHQAFPLPDFKPAQAAAKVKAWLDTIQDEKKHVKTFDVAGCQFKIETTKKIYKPTIGCVLAEFSGVNDVPNYADRIKRKLNQKRTKYSSKTIDMPLLIVLADGVGLVRVDEHAIDKALFGQFTFTIFTNSDKPGQFGRDRSGHFTPSNDARGDWFGKNTGISSVLFSSYKGEGHFQMQMFHNPVAKLPIPFEPFKIMPQLVLVEKKPNITMRWAIKKQDNYIENPENSRVAFNQQ
jgi:hypothetical protein